jgi:transcriptional regulator GlxA family with amidase domain
VVTSGGSASWSDLALYLIARFRGREEAIRTAKVFLLGDRSDGQLPFSAMMRPHGHGDAVMEDCQAWIAQHYSVASPVTAMIARAALAPRTFKRRFRTATGYTPIEYVQTLRIEEAKHLLETSDLPTDAIAASVGYRDPASFRRLFKRLTGVSPARYRQRFNRIGEPAGTNGQRGESAGARAGD